MPPQNPHKSVSTDKNVCKAASITYEQKISQAATM